MGTTESLRATLSDLREVWSSVIGKSLSERELTTVNTLFSAAIARGERRLAKIIAKASAQIENEETEVDRDAEGACAETEHAATSTDSAEQAGAKHGSTSSATESADSSASADKPRPGHGRNGAGAYVGAEHNHHALHPDIIGALCEACGIGRVSRYREKLIVVVKGQPLFGAETHHFEQGRCKLCGAILRADGTNAVTDGLGSGIPVRLGKSRIDSIA